MGTDKNKRWSRTLFSTHHTCFALVLLLYTLSPAPCPAYPPATVPSLLMQTELDKKISRVWQECVTEGIRDYDRNGKVNCCDRATAFCIKWRRKYDNNVRLAQQMSSRIDHMYVLIETTGGWWAIDPAYDTAGRHDMEAVWGSRYVRGRDDTEAYWVKYFSRYIW